MFFKIGVLKNFAIFTGKHLCWNSFFHRKPTVAASGQVVYGIRKIAPRKIAPQKITPQKFAHEKIAPYENISLWIFLPMEAPPVKITLQKFVSEKIAPYENSPSMKSPPHL